VKITFDPGKRERTLVERGLDFADTERVFAGVTIDIPDDRKEYGEERTISFGWLAGRLVVVVWTRRDGARRIISMRKANEREQERFGKRLGEG